MADSQTGGSADERILKESPHAISPFTPGGGSEIAQDDLSSVGLLELLEVDDRPTFVLDLSLPTKAKPVFYNASLREIPLLELKIGRGITAASTVARDPKYASFLEWALSTSRNGSLPNTTYCGVKWTAKTIKNRWQVVSGQVGSQNVDAGSRRQSEIHRLGRSQTSFEPPERKRPYQRADPPAQDEALEAQLAAFRLRRDDAIQTFPSWDNPTSSTDSSNESKDSWKQTISKNAEALSARDFTRSDTLMEISEHVRFVLEFDWAATALGPISSWSIELRKMANFLINDPRPAALFWGKNRTILYNAPYVEATGQKHPGMMGKTFSEAWSEVDGDFTPAFDHAAATGESFIINDARFYIDRFGYVEETYYSISILPFVFEEGQIAFYNPVFETTKQVIADRRMACLLRLGQYIASAREPKDFWRQLLLSLEAENLDLQFSIIYSAGGDMNETPSEFSEYSANLRNWTLEGLIRIPETSATSIPSRITSELEMEEFLPNFPQLVAKDSPTLLLAEDGSMPDFMSKILVMNGEHACESAVFLPIRSTADKTLGFIIIGLNPRKRYDDDYKVFMELLSRQLATSMASAVLFEDEIRRGRLAAEQATQDRDFLSKKAHEAETRFKRMADLAPVGMYHIDPEGVLVYANNDYYTMTGHPKDVKTPMSWYGVIHEDDHPIMDIFWAKLLGGETVTFELRLRTPFVAEELIGGEKVKGDFWIIAAAYAEKADDGTTVGILGCITDISRQKWMEGFQTRKMLEAVELKRQQENFIDMTSHEMRNPLSAIIQSADWICTSLAEFGGDTKNVTIPREVIDGYSDAAQTIVLCSQHQKRIIDDILTLSKLDSDLLLITPVEAQPVSVIKSALKIFDSELQKSDMELRFNVDPSYEEHQIDWLKLDPSRLLQVLINLTTNAIKFTQTETNRKIKISVGASKEEPKDVMGMEYLPRSSSRKDMSLGSAWGTGEMVFLSIQVEDTGRGLDEIEKNLLFKRFSQTSPRTHVQYGGSGLGLFISRELTELQGGRIGVASQSGIGSTFAFYVRTRRCSPPESSTPPRINSIDLKAQSRIISPAAITRLQNGLAPGKRDKKSLPVLVSPKHVLIVEDNIVNQKVLCKQLLSAGCIVHVANHGREALSFLSTTRYWTGLESTGVKLSVVLMDLEMPVMDGLTCIKTIRELQREGKIKGHIPVIAVTANARSEQIALAKESGMDSVVTKPFRIPELLPEMERQVARARELDGNGNLGERLAVRAELERSSSAPAAVRE